MNDQEIMNAGFDSAQSPNPETETVEVTTNAPQPSESANSSVPESDPRDILWNSLQEDPYGTISFLVQHYGWRPDMYPNQPSMLPNTPPALANPNPAVQPQPELPQQPDPWQQLVLNIALRMWQSEAASIVKQRAQEDGLELSDADLQHIFLNALEKYAGDIDSAYAAFAYPRLKARANQKQQSAEEKEPESGDLMSSIIMAGYR